MRILVVLPPLEEYSPLTGGAVSTVAEALARRWIERGHDVTVLSQATSDAYTTGTVEFHSYRLPERRQFRRLILGVIRRLRRYDWPLYTSYAFDVRRAIKRSDPDWLVLHNDVVFPALGRRPSRPKIAITLHNSVNSRNLRRARRSLLRCQLVTAVSSYIAQETTRSLRLPPTTIQVFNNGVETSLYSGRRRDVDADGRLRVVVMGRLLFDKGAHVLTEAVELLASRGLLVRPTVLGSPGFHRSTGDQGDPYVRRVREALSRQDGRHIEHLGRTEVSLLLREQDVLVAPSLFPDPFPLVVFEGMASGCAVVVSDQGGLPEAAGDAGIVVPAGDAGALAEALADLHMNHAALARRQEASLERARENDWTGVADKWLDAFTAAETR